MNLPLWQQPAPVAEKKVEKTPMISLTQEEAEKVAADTRTAIDAQGYCLWTCQILRGEIIVLVEDEKLARLPAPLLKYANYTLLELELIEDLSDKTCRLVHLAKKLGGARVIGVRETTDVEKAAFQRCSSEP